MRFRSTILERDGSTVTAELESADAQTLHDQLHREGRTLVRVKVLDDGARRVVRANVSLSTRRLLMLTQALHEALDAGVPLLSAFRAVGEQEADPRVAAMLEELADSVAAGEPLSQALAAHPRAFPGIYCALVRAGEQSGSLPSVLQSIAGFLEWKMEIGGVVKQAMIYPIVVGIAGYAMVLFLLSFVIPRLGSVISKIGNELPPASRMLIECSGFVAENILSISLGSAGVAVLAFLAIRTAVCREIAVALLSGLPVVRSVVGTLATAQFCRTFSVLLNAGLTMTAALEMGAAAVSLPRLRRRIDESRERIVGGARLGEAFEAAEVMPPVALSMVKVGEEAGRLPVTFERLSRLYDREVKEAVKKALGMLEPAVTVLLGIIVGGIAALVVGTIYSAMKGIGR
jgi:type II secretory pathway component PulF